LKNGVIGTAHFSSCGKYRWLLTRRWDITKPVKMIVWIMMNPSTATADVNDPTIAKVCRLSKRWGFNTVYILNMLAYRATKPQDCRKVVDPLGVRNLDFIKTYALSGSPIICAWGKTHPKLAHYETNMRVMLRSVKTAKFYVLKLNNAGGPYHPLYVTETDFDKLQPYKT